METTIRSKCLQLLEGNLCWQRTQENLTDIFQGINFKQKSILDYNTKLYFKRVRKKLSFKKKICLNNINWKNKVFSKRYGYQSRDY